MLKLLGSACILAGSVLAQAVRLSDRCRQWDTLSDMLSALRQMGEEIRQARTPMPLLLEYLAKVVLDTRAGIEALKNEEKRLKERRQALEQKIWGITP